MKVLVTGAAGYIGSIVTAELLNNGYEVVAFDDLSQGHRRAVDGRATFIKASLGDEATLENVFTIYRPEACIHLAAISNVEQSFSDVHNCFKTNIVYGEHLLDTMVRYDVRRMVFSSTASVYGEPMSLPITEEHSNNALSPYAESKLIFEKLLAWYSQAYDVKFVSLRYFNAAGATKTLGENHRPETHLIPKVFEVASGHKDRLIVYGDDHATPDGTCIRDYIHVLDIARAHILALESLDHVAGEAYNLGTGRGFSVLEIINMARKITGAKIPVTVSNRRRGDPARLVADSEKIKRDLDWQPQFSELERIVASAWQWHKTHPIGYEDKGAES